MMMDRMTREKPYSEKTAEVIDSEVKNLIDEAAERARIILTANRDLLEKLKDELLVKETLEAEEVAEILRDAVLPPSANLK